VHGAPGQVGVEVARLAERDALGRIFLGPEGTLALSTAHGALVILDHNGVERERYEGGGDGVRSVSIRPDRIAAAFRDETVRVWARATGVTLGTLRVPGASVTFLDEAGTELRLVSDVLEDRLVALPRYPPRIPLDAGVGGLSLSPDGERVAVALGDGSTEEYDLRDGRQTGRWRWQAGVNKDIAYGLDGRWLAPALTAAVEQRLLPRPDGPALTTALPAIGFRRVTWMASGWLLAPSYVPAVWGWKEGMAIAVKVLDTPMRELERSADGQTGASLDGEGWLWRWTSGDPPTASRIAPFETAVACAPLGKDTLLLQDTYIMRVDDTGTVRWRAPTGTKGHDIAVAPDGLHIATTLVDGDVLIWRVDGELPVARLVGHTSRVGEAAWSPDGQWLVTGGWDDSIRMWWMGTLETPAEVLRDEIERAWGRGLTDVLDDPIDTPSRAPQPVRR